MTRDKNGTKTGQKLLVNRFMNKKPKLTTNDLKSLEEPRAILYPPQSLKNTFMPIKKLFVFAAIISVAAVAGCSSNDQIINFALNKAAYASSNYDFNLTAQLVTDGVVEAGEPAWLRVSTAEGELTRREKEWTVDAGPYSSNRMEGATNFLEYEWSGQRFSAASVRLRGYVVYQEPSNGWSITCMAGDSASEMNNVGFIGDSSLLGTMRFPVTVTDPNKETESITRPARAFNLEIPLKDAVDFNHFKVEFKMDGAIFWVIYAVDFSLGPTFGKSSDTGPYDSKESRGFNVLPSEVFSSAWMSADEKPQWIRVDLGTKRKFREIRLHWIHRAEKGCIEISDDTKNWKKIAYLPQTDSLTYSFKAVGSARYVRLSMEGADESGHFALSEMEVLGSQTEKEAKTEWRLLRASAVTEGGEALSTNEYDDSSWLPAVVPGTVLYSYIAAGAVPDPGIADNNLQISESYFNSDFWYRWTPSSVAELVEATKRQEGKRLLLSFDGINWKAEVYVNGKHVGNIAGAFKRASFDITDLIQDENNVIAVHIIKPAHFAAVKEKNTESPDFNGGQLGADNPTFHATVGWDWMPTVRGRDMGIWNDVRIEKVNAVTLIDPLVQSKIVDGLASMTVSVKVSDVASQSLSLAKRPEKIINGTLRGTIGDIEFLKKVQLKAGESGTIIFTPDEYPQLKEQKIALWWPNGYGEPILHKATFSFIPDGSSEAIASIEWLAGVREFTYCDELSDLKMFINGRRFFPKGGNWGFSEYNLRYGAKEYDTAVRMHKEMNLNMIRNWVGQTGDEEFYAACDKYGIVVWQDFWLANPADGPEPDDNEMFLDNAKDYVSLIRKHPSIGLYCGRNEGYPPAALNTGLVKTVKTLHSDIVYIPSSADDGVSGHGPYRAVEPSFYFENPTAKFHSERGMPAIMEYESLRQMLTSDHLWPTNDVWGQHDFTRTGAQGDTAFVGMVRRRFGDQVMESAETFAKYAQWINYDGYRAMYEANNVGRNGLLIWMSHSAWPSLAWQTYDYWFRPTAACAAVKKACEPLHIQLNPATSQIEVVNASCGDLENLTASVSVVNPNGEEIYSKAARISPAEDTTTPVIDVADVPDGLCIMTLKLTSADGKVLSENRYFRNFRSGKDIGDYKALVGTKWLDDTILRFD